MKLKPLARNAFGIVAATTVAGLGLAAAPASADITGVRGACFHEGFPGACTGEYIMIEATDSTPVWVTLNGTVLGGSPFTLNQDTTGYHAQLVLDCRLTPLHIVAVQKSASGTITSQQASDFTPPSTVEGAIMGDLISGSATGSAQAWQAATGDTTPNVGSASGSKSAVNAAKVGSAESAGCHVTAQY